MRAGPLANAARSPSRDERGEQLAGLAGHLLVDALEPLDQAADVVVAVAVLPDVLDDLGDRPGGLRRRLGGDAGGLAEVLQQRAVEAVEDGEVRLVGELLALARAAAEHLLEEDAGLHRAQEDDELQVRDVHAGGEQVHGDDDAGLGPVAELADALERAVHVGPVIFWTKESPRPKTSRQMSTSWSACEVCGQVVGGEDQGLGEAAVLLLVLERVLA